MIPCNKHFAVSSEISETKFLIYLFINNNQLDALKFIISLFQASTRFELIELYFNNFNYFSNFRPLTRFSVMIAETV